MKILINVRLNTVYIPDWSSLPVECTHLMWKDIVASGICEVEPNLGFLEPGQEIQNRKTHLELVTCDHLQQMSVSWE